MFARPFRATLVYLALASALVSANGSHEHSVGHRHHAINITSLNITSRDVHLQKRFDNARYTFFAPGINACGSFDHEYDSIVALNIHQWEGGSNCYKEITVSYEGRSAKARITDQCPTCPWGALDLSPSLFLKLVPGGFDQGVAYGSWHFGGDGGHEEEPKPKPSPKPKPKPDPTPEWKEETTTTTKKKKTTTTTEEKPTSTSSKSKSKSKTSTTTSKEKTTSSSSTSSSSTSSTSTAPTATVTSFHKGNINSFNLALVQLVELSQANMAARDEA
ncbi:hypothetical protein C8Q76DRAFT_95981 [Earliella scabrosa]|nr:hypothetical protein C8Q76DRAFT_95981 [Earliella scabrosa]